MDSLAQHCEQLVETKLLTVPSNLQHALELAAEYPTSGKFFVHFVAGVHFPRSSAPTLRWAAGENLCRMCCRLLAQQLEGREGDKSALELLPSLVESCREVLQHGFEELLTQRLSRQRRQVPSPTSPGRTHLSLNLNP